MPDSFRRIQPFNFPHKSMQVIFDEQDIPLKAIPKACRFGFRMRMVMKVSQEIAHDWQHVPKNISFIVRYDHQQSSDWTHTAYKDTSVTLKRLHGYLTHDFGENYSAFRWSAAYWVDEWALTTDGGLKMSGFVLGFDECVGKRPIAERQKAIREAMLAVWLWPDNDIKNYAIIELELDTSGKTPYYRETGCYTAENAAD